MLIVYFRRCFSKPRQEGMRTFLFCNRSDPSSERIMVENDGIYDNETEDGDEIEALYWIMLKKRALACWS